MNLLEFAQKRINPTPDQKAVFKALDDFLQSSEKCFLLKGYAGTGKTTITKVITEYIRHKKMLPRLFAPTGRAARILSDKTGYEASTIHKGMYNIDDVDEIEVVSNGKKQYKYRYNLNTIDSNIIEVFLVDEASMISDKKSEQDFFVFGSGVLLKDILTIVSPWNTARKIKIIFIGDPAQLPPVSDSISGALSAFYLKKTYDITTLEYEMTDVVRQEQNSGILKLANYLRNRLLNTSKKSIFEIKTESDDIVIIEPREVAEQYQKLNPGLKLNETVVINFSNKEALDYNLTIRERYFQNKYQIGVGDLMMITQNNYNYSEPLFNGTMVKVTKVSPTPLLRPNIPSFTRTGEECKVSLKFRHITIMLEDEHIEQECLILEDFLYNENAQLTYEEHIALYIDFKIRNPNLQPKTKEFKDTLRRDPYFNALRVKYGYAVTCHKAQGGEWESVLINMALNAGRQSDFFNRWLYTAVTRAEKKLYLFNYKNETVFSKLEFVPDYSFDEKKTKDDEQIKSINYILPANIDEEYSKFDLIHAEYFQKEKFKEVLARANYYDYNIIARKTHAYQEQYTFEKEGKRVTLVFWYRGNKKFQNITILNPNKGDVEFKKIVYNNFEKQIEILFDETGVGDFSTKSFEELELKKGTLFDKEYERLRPLYDALSTILADKEISITEVSHLQHREDYVFERKGERAELQFYYDGQSRFTKVFNVTKKCNSVELIKDIVEAVECLKNN